MNVCPDCNGTKLYQPLFGGPEPCGTCCLPVEAPPCLSMKEEQATLHLMLVRCLKAETVDGCTLSNMKETDRTIAAMEKMPDGIERVKAAMTEAGFSPTAFTIPAASRWAHYTSRRSANPCSEIYQATRRVYRVPPVHGYTGSWDSGFGFVDLANIQEKRNIVAAMTLGMTLEEAKAEIEKNKKSLQDEIFNRLMFRNKDTDKCQTPVAWCQAGVSAMMSTLGSNIVERRETYLNLATMFLAAAKAIDEPSTNT